MTDPRPPLAIVGPTASGKSALAMTLADAHPTAGVEIVSVDSMQVYRGMDIGTATPGPADRARVPHHLLDLLEPSQECSVAWYQSVAREVLDEVDRRGATPVLVGGTGLYHRAVVDRLEIPGRWPEVAAELAADADTAGLYRRLVEVDPVAAARMGPANRRRVIRALEVTLGGGRRFSSYGPGLDAYPEVATVQVGLELPRDVLADRIRVRLADQVAAGFVEEVRALDRRPEGWSRTAGQALGYRELLDHVRADRDLEACLADAEQRTRRFAARQLRWFRRDPRITWFDATRADLAVAVAEHWDRARPPVA